MTDTPDWRQHTENLSAALERLAQRKELTDADFNNLFIARCDLDRFTPPKPKG